MISKVDNLIRCPLLKTIEALDIAVINGNSTGLSEFKRLRTPRPKVMDISLEKIGRWTL